MLFLRQVFTNMQKALKKNFVWGIIGKTARCRATNTQEKRGENKMNELAKIVKETVQKTGISFTYYPENTRPLGIPVCDKPFETVTDDGAYTFFRFYFKGVGYIGAIDGAGEIQRNYATLLPAFIESFTDKESELSKSEYLKRILLGECSALGIVKYSAKFSVKGVACFALVVCVPKMMEETLALIEQYGGNSLDTVVQMSDTQCVLVKYVDDTNLDGASPVDYAEFLAQSLKEELGIDVKIGVGTTVSDVKDVAQSYLRAEDAIRYAEEFNAYTGSSNVYSYREFVLLKMLEEWPENKLAAYFDELTDEHFGEVLEDEELLETAEEFLNCNLNVSEAARRLYLHRNTMIYRLDKIEKATGLNIRSFHDAVSFRILTLIYRLLGKS